MKASCFSRAAWVGFLVSALMFCALPSARAQTSAWDPGISKDLFKDDLTPKDKANPKKAQKPIHRLAPTTCDDCQKIVDDLQKALDDWYALELADANETIQTSVGGGKTAVSQPDARAQKDDALAGLGQKDRPPPKGKTKADVKKQIDTLGKALADCLDKCKETPTPTPTPTPIVEVTPSGSGVKLPVLPTLPGCWMTPADKTKFDAEWSAAETELLKLRRANMPEGGGQPDEEAVPKINDAFKELNELKRKEADVKPCGQGMVPKTSTGHYVSFPSGPEDSFCSLITKKKITANPVGTGETIGHVADLKIENLTDAVLTIVIPALVLESRSGKNQDYACPEGETIEVPPHQTETVPLNGVCLVRTRPPVGQGVGDDLVIDGCDPDAHISGGQAHHILNIAQSKYAAADQLQKDGKFKDFPYKDKKKQKDIVVQWSTWMDPQICEITGAPAATKDDLKKVVYKQVEEQGPVTPEKKKKIDEGIDTIFDKIELTTEKAKDLEKPETDEDETDDGVPTYSHSETVSSPTATPTPKPKTKAKPTPTPTPTPRKSGGTKSKPTPTPTPTPEPAMPMPKPGKPPDTYQDPEDTDVLPPAQYPHDEDIDCGHISITIKDGEIIFDFTPSNDPKCKCKKFGWIQHYRAVGEDANTTLWHYDNGVNPSVTHGGSGSGAVSHPSKPNQPTQPPDPKKPDDWQGPENPWYGGTNTGDPAKAGDYARNPKPKTHVSDKPNTPATTYRMQLVCVETGEVLFTWAWGPFPNGNESPDKVGGKSIPPP